MRLRGGWIGPSRKGRDETMMGFQPQPQDHTRPPPLTGSFMGLLFNYPDLPSAHSWPSCRLIASVPTLENFTHTEGILQGQALFHHLGLITHSSHSELLCCHSSRVGTCTGEAPEKSKDTDLSKDRLPAIQGQSNHGWK